MDSGNELTKKTKVVVRNSMKTQISNFCMVFFLSRTTILKRFGFNKKKKDPFLLPQCKY